METKGRAGSQPSTKATLAAGGRHGSRLCDAYAGVGQCKVLPGNLVAVHIVELKSSLARDIFCRRG